MDIRVVAAEHRHRSRNVEPAHGDLDVEIAELFCQIEHVRELVRLHADEHHHAIACFADHRRQFLRPDPRVGLVQRMNLDLDIVAEHVPLFAVEREPVKCRERVRGDGRTQPLDHVPVVIIMRRLDQDQAKALRSCR